MKTDDAEPLWREVVGDTEPWKRGRLALVLLGALTAGQQLLTAASIIGVGNVELLLPAGIFWVLQWLQFYLMWVGVQWIRYLAGTLTAFGGLAQFFDGCMHHNGLYIVLGLAVVAMGCYLAFAPALYHFAKHQQQRRSIAWTLITAGCFVILLAMVFVGMMAFAALKTSWEHECRNFAREAFDHIFVEPDPEFLARHSTKGPKDMSPGRFLDATHEQLGALQISDPAEVRVRSRLAWPIMHMDAIAMWHASFTNAPRLTIWMQLSSDAGEWQIEHIRWDYR